MCKAPSGYATGTVAFNAILVAISVFLASTFWASALFTRFSSAILSTWSAYVLLTNFFLELSYTPTSTLISSIFSYQLS